MMNRESGYDRLIAESGGKSLAVGAPSQIFVVEFWL